MATPGKLKAMPIRQPADVWTLRERLALVCSVMRSGDQNWVSVSRAIRPFAEPGRPPDWFSQKNCAMQYSQLLEKVETPKRKRSEKSEIRETPSVVITRKVTIERIEELKSLVKEEQDRYRKLKTEVEMIRAGQMDDQLKDMVAEMDLEKKDGSGSASSPPNKLPDELTPAALAAKSALFNKIKRETAGLTLRIPGTSQPDETSQDSLADSNASVDEVAVLSLGGANDFPIDQSDVIQSDLLSDLLENSALQRALIETKEQMKQKDLKSEFGDLPEEVVMVEDGAEVIVDVDIKQETVVVDDSVIEEEVKVEVDSMAETVSDFVEVSTTGGTVEIKTEPGVLGRDVVIKSESDRKSVSEPTVVVDVAEDRRDDVDVESVDDVDDKRMNVEAQQVEVVTPDTPTTAGGRISLSSSAMDLEEPLSPASSVVSNETDTGSIRGRSQRRSRGGKTTRRYKRRPLRKRAAEEERKESESSKLSEAESSDEDGAPNESDDTASNTTSKHLLNVTDSVPNSPASITHSDMEDEKAHKNWKKSIMLVWRMAANHKYANVFLHPVTEDIAPGYSSIVCRPMELLTIKRNVDSGMTRTTAEFQRDMMLMFTNAIMYNSANHNVFKMATEMYDDVMMHIEQFVSTQMMVQSEAKVLRASSRTRYDVTSDKEDELKKRKVIPVPEPESGGKKKRKP